MPIPYRRTFLKQDLARKLYPDSISSASALQQLRREINLYPTLKEQLEQAGNTRKHYYNIKQVQLIMAHLGIELDETPLQSKTKFLSCKTNANKRSNIQYHNPRPILWWELLW